MKVSNITEIQGVKNILRVGAQTNPIKNIAMSEPLTAATLAVGAIANNFIDHYKTSLGCNYDAMTDNLSFKVASKNATHINLYLFDKPVDGKVIKTVEMQKQGDIWTAKLDKKDRENINLDLKNTPVYYGYRAWGPNWEYDKNWTPSSTLGFVSHVDDKGNRFNPNKLLFDPYAKEISHDPISPDMQKREVNENVYTTGQENYKIDTASFAPKSIFTMPKNISTGIKPQRELSKDIIYETHLRGFSKLDTKIPEKYRGTYLGAAMKAKYLKEMGVTMVEFLPLQEFDDEKNDSTTDKTNYWGYQTLDFFAPNRRYAYDKSAGGPTNEFKKMVKAFHDEGIKVCMDVVYNHSGEGGTWGDKDVTTLLSMRGLDNSSYYETHNNGKYYWDNSGCGANLNCANDITSNLIAESLKYWSQEMGVDAFRFDLAPVIVNTVEKDGYNFDSSKSPTLNKIAKNLDLRTGNGKGSVDLIAEPWGCGDGTYRLGQFPKTWHEWNDAFRNVIRGMFNRQENTPLAKITTALAGSSNIFNGKSTRSVNFITCHDGFTLKDLFSFNNPFNDNPNFKSDGGTMGEGNISWDNFGDFKRQIKAVKNAFLTLFVSKGTPMISAGDEILKTQQGNNNAYNLDKFQNYLNWNLNEEQKKVQEFVKKAANFRHAHPALSNPNFFDGKDHNNNGLKDVTWLKDDGKEADGNYLNAPYNNFLGCRIDGSEYSDSATSIYTVINKGESEIQMTMPDNVKGKKWYLVADTADDADVKDNFANVGEELEIGKKYVSSPRSTMIFIEK